jgi:WD40 repeat protein
MSQMPSRYRGVVLTPQGIRRLEDAIALAQEQEKFGSRFTQTELSERTKLSIKTVKKIRAGKIPTDEASVRALFTAFALEDLEPADYGQPDPISSTPDTHALNSNSFSTPKIDWGEKPDTALFFGRAAELATLNQWVQGDQCRLITLLGMGGIGKTSLAAKLANQVYDRFDYVIWRSLREAPPLDEILVRLIQFLSDQQETEVNLPTRLGERIIRLLHYLRKHRCLVMLDNLESILQAETAGHYRDGYEGYGELIQRIGSTEHQSCLLLTSRECPRELAPLAGDLTPVRLWSVGSIDTEAGRDILKTKGLALDEADDQGQELIRRCSGNPQALHLVATAIQREFLGDVDDFLQEQVTAVEDVRSLLDQHLGRLAPLERSVLFWLAINREPVGLDELMEDLLPPVTKQEVRGALRGLSDRYLIEKIVKQFTLQNVVMEFTTEYFIRQVCLELKDQNYGLFHSHALIKATAEDYVREVQIRLILKPIADNAKLQKNYLISCLEAIRRHSSWSQGYSAGNLLNLLCKTIPEVSEINFSMLTLRQVHLNGARLKSVSFANSSFIQSSITQTFSHIYSVDFSPDGKLFASGDSNGNIHLWQVETQRQVHDLRGHSSAVWSLSFSPDGKFLISGSSDSTIRIWDIHKLQCIHVLRGYKNWVCSISVSPNGRFLASSSTDSRIRLWDIKRQQIVHEFKGHNRWFSSIAFSPDSKILVSGGEDDTIRFWDVDNRRIIHILEGHTGPIHSISFSPNADFFVTGSSDNTVRLWNLEERICVGVLKGHTDCVRSLAVSPDGKVIASGSSDSTIRLWDFDQKCCISLLSGHSSWIWSVSFSPDGQYLVSGSGDSTIRFWDIKKKQCLRVFEGYTHWIESVAYSINGKHIISGSSDATIRLWSTESEQCIHTLSGHTNWVGDLDFDLGSGLLASGSGDGTIRLWNIQERKNIYVLKGHDNAIRSIAFSPDGKFIASGSEDSTIRLWDAHNKSCIHIFEEHVGWVWSVDFSPDGKYLASAGNDAKIRCWDLTKQKCVNTFEGHSHWIEAISFSPNGKLLASGSEDSTIRLWETHKHDKCLHIFAGHTFWVRSVAFSPDNNFLASGSGDCTVRIWDICNKQCLRVLKGHNNQVSAVSFHPNGRSVASSSRDGTIRIWDILTGNCLSILQVSRPYENTDIADVQGLTEAQRTSFIALGGADLTIH